MTSEARAQPGQAWIPGQRQEPASAGHGAGTAHGNNTAHGNDAAKGTDAAHPGRHRRAPEARASYHEVFAIGEFRALWSAQVLSYAGDQFAR